MSVCLLFVLFDIFITSANKPDKHKSFCLLGCKSFARIKSSPKINSKITSLQVSQKKYSYQFKLKFTLKFFAIVKYARII